jgi:acetylornithine aminotransferase
VKVLPAQYIARARELTRRSNALLVVDEVQTGIGRTGEWFAHQNPDIVASAQIVPDIVTVAKGLGGGFPIGAVIAFGEAAQILQPGDHGTTFGGNPLACAVGSKVLEVMERDNLLDHAKRMCEFVGHLILELKNPHIREVTGSGLLLAFNLPDERSAEVVKVALSKGLIVNAVNPSAIRIAPALNIDSVTLERAIILLNESINEVYASDGGK